MDTTVSSGGLNWLASFLLSPELDLVKVKQRQQMVKALVPRSLFRDRLILEAKKISDKRLCNEKILAGLKSTSTPTNVKTIFIIEITLVILTILFVGLDCIFHGLRYWPYSFITYVLIYFFYLGRLAPIFDKALTLQSQLKGLESLLIFLEKSNVPELKDLLAPFHTSQSVPSQMIRSITRICDALSVRGNPLIHLSLNMVCPWDIYFTIKYEKVREEVGKLFPVWLDKLGQIEAIASLAQFASLHPDYIFPQFFIGGKEDMPGINAIDMGHPLIADYKRVNNDFRIEGIGSLMLITGSNMSGKSTFLRTIGINLCLAQAGGPVCARHFLTSLIRICCSLRIKDDLEEGVSYF